MQQVRGGYLDSRQHDSDQVVVGEQQGTNYTAVTHMFDDGWGEEGEEHVKKVRRRVLNYDDIYSNSVALWYFSKRRNSCKHQLKWIYDRNLYQTLTTVAFKGNYVVSEKNFKLIDKINDIKMQTEKYSFLSITE